MIAFRIFSSLEEALDYLSDGGKKDYSRLDNPRAASLATLAILSDPRATIEQKEMVQNRLKTQFGFEVKNPDGTMVKYAIEPNPKGKGFKLWIKKEGDYEWQLVV